MARWTLADVPWEAFDASRVDPDTVKIVKAAAMVEHNGDDYAAYLCNVFADDPEFSRAARAWAKEEIRHGKALARWAALADPEFDFAASFKRFTEGYRLPLEAKESVRGSRSGELVARCIVEVGTSSFYSAIGDSTDEPVLKDICRRIAADEVRHYKLFRKTLRRYVDKEGIGFWGRLRVAVRRLMEAGDDELPYAYYAANGKGEAYDRRRHAHAYVKRTFWRYRLSHVERGMSMILKAVGLRHKGWVNHMLSRLAHRVILHVLRRARSAEPAGA